MLSGSLKVFERLSRRYQSGSCKAFSPDTKVRFFPLSLTNRRAVGREGIPPSIVGFVTGDLSGFRTGAAQLQTSLKIAIAAL
jgi:hypothetical protein